MLEDEFYNYDYYFKCHYVISNSTDDRQKDIFTITNYFEYNGEEYKNIITANEWHSVHSDLSYNQCKNLKNLVS